MDKLSHSAERSATPKRAGRHSRADEVISLLSKARFHGNGRGSALCPAHEDGHASLSFKILPDKILLHCFAGCDTRAIVDALGLSILDLFFDTPDTPRFRKIKTLARPLSADWHEQRILSGRYGLSDSEARSMVETRKAREAEDAAKRSAEVISRAFGVGEDSALKLARNFVRRWNGRGMDGSKGAFDDPEFVSRLFDVRPELAENLAERYRALQGGGAC